MSQSDDEIKKTFKGSVKVPVKVSVSRDQKPRDVFSEPKFCEKKEIEMEAISVERREFFQAVIPATGKAVTNILRSLNAQLPRLAKMGKTTDSEKSD